MTRSGPFAFQTFAAIERVMHDHPSRGPILAFDRFSPWPAWAVLGQMLDEIVTRGDMHVV